MIKIKTRLLQAGNPLEWTPASKAALILAVCVIMHAQYITWAYYQLSGFAPEANAQYVNLAFLQDQLTQYGAILLFSAALFTAVFLLRTKYPDNQIFEYIGALYYGLTLSYCSYLIGNFSIATGVVLAGAPVVGFILFNQRAVFTAFFISLAAQGYISYAHIQGDILYAPVVNNLISAEGMYSAYWILNMYMFTLPHLLVLTVAAYFVLQRWRRREEEVIMLSLTDPLTHLSNRRSILNTLTKEVARSCRHDPPLSIILVDLDHFKNINDTQGHPAGDQVLVAAADSLRSSIRQSDHVGRYGGEEFLIILPETNTENALQLAERCRRHLESREIRVGKGKKLHVTGSFGLFCNEKDRCDTSESMLHFADEALYGAKDQGRNRVVVYQSQS